ncbi:MAG: FAD-dependent oxidoreductase [Acetobacteraceae bacterium]|nr:FAD-dependent oxidoreductase [Acetobacteraceae bacterium]MDW8397541.1 FAD-dependent oxidoreductase [Acetobacteraceae bacterium]
MPTALVLGAGIMGLSAAWGLSRAGFSVTVLDRALPPNPRGASADNHRLIRHAYGAEAGYMRMVSDAFAAWEALFDETGERLLVPTGVLALSAAGGGWLAESRAALLAEGFAVEDLPPAAVAARFPFLRAEGLSEAFAMREGGVLLARRILAALARRLAVRGVSFRRAEAREADPERGRLTLADGGTAEADLLVLAAGPWAPRLLPGILPVRPTRQIVVELEPPPEHRPAWAQAPMLLEIDPGAGFYAVPPVAGTPLKIGDHRFAPDGDPDGPPAASPAEADAILALAAPRIAGLQRYRVLAARACHYDVAPEERFILRPLGARGVVMSGFSGHGFKFGPLLGLGVAVAATRPDRADAVTAWAAGLAPPPPGLLPRR